MMEKLVVRGPQLRVEAAVRSRLPSESFVDPQVLLEGTESLLFEFDDRLLLFHRVQT